MPSWWSKIKKFLEEVAEFLNRKETKEAIVSAGKIIAIIVQAVGMFNRERTGPEQREAVRTITKFLQIISPEKLEEIAKQKREGSIQVFDTLKSSEKDIIIGTIISAEANEKGK
ncbi:MAG: hypothetical protein GY847_01765 [Proteobacteria bacterium]|nr:hypothetical protein [Pseudomonadota bacterium]